MKTVVLIIGFGMMLGCGKPQYHDPEFTSYVTNFQTTYNKDTSVVSIEFDPLLEGTSVNGVCTNKSSITIQRSKWMTLTEEMRQELINHELGHCIFGRVHTTELFPDGCPKSIMYPSLFYNNCLDLHKDAYTAELPHN